MSQNFKLSNDIYVNIDKQQKNHMYENRRPICAVQSRSTFFTEHILQSTDIVYEICISTDPSAHGQEDVTAHAQNDRSANFVYAIRYLFACRCSCDNVIMSKSFVFPFIIS